MDSNIRYLKKTKQYKTNSNRKATKDYRSLKI